MTPDAATLAGRLARHGLRPVSRVRVTQNRSVLVSLSRQPALSVHRAYLDAPDEVLHAIVRFVSPGATRETRRQTQQTILAWYNTTWRLGDLATDRPPSRRPDRRQSGDEEALTRLGLLFSEYNQRHFMGSLPEIPIRLSGRMQTRLGHLMLDRAGQPAEITISRRHLHQHGWDEAAQTLLHEMVHLWQCANGHPVDHGAAFRKKARETGVTAAARRWVRRRPTHHALRTTHQTARTTHQTPLTLF